MASLGGTFNPNEIPQDERSFEPIPAGDYTCQVIESEIRPTKSGGDMLRLTLEVVDGPFANRRIWENLNIRNSNPQAQSIAHRALADLCAACGAGAIDDSEELHFKPFVATIKIEPGRDGYEPRNGVKRYKPRGGQPGAGKAPVQRQAAPQQASAPRPNGSAPSRPWANRGQPEAARNVNMDDVPF